MYSSIKADRWSCGRVLLYLLDMLRKGDVPLRTIARELSADNPKQRPSLSDWRARSLPLSNLGDIPNTDERKPLRSRQDSMAVDGENAMPPNAKEQKLNGLNQNEMTS